MSYYQNFAAVNVLNTNLISKWQSLYLKVFLSLNGFVVFLRTKFGSLNIGNDKPGIFMRPVLVGDHRYVNNIPYNIQSIYSLNTSEVFL